MRCYQIGDTIDGLLVDRESTPSIQTPKGSLFGLVLTRTLRDLFLEAPRYWCTLRQARVSVTTKHIVLDAEETEDTEKAHQALVRMTTASGVDGKVRLTAGSYNEREVNNWITRFYHPFPSAGVQAFCTTERLTELCEGTDALDVVLLMQPGSTIRVSRDGQLEGGFHELLVRWNGSRLNTYARGGVCAGFADACV